MFRYVVALTVLLAGCSSKHELAKCKGPLLVLNTNHWQPTASDVAALNRICPEDR
jgi:hypothetical protein